MWIPCLPAYFRRYLGVSNADAGHPRRAFRTDVGANGGARDIASIPSDLGVVAGCRTFFAFDGKIWAQAGVYLGGRDYDYRRTAWRLGADFR